jgi:transposase-like protein
MATCPECGSKHTVKNGHIDNGKQRFLCSNCGRQIGGNPENKVISQATKDLIDKLLLERISLAGIARVTDVSELWLQKYVNVKYETVPRHVQVQSTSVPFS